jgi:hypothetical protein
VNALQFRGCLRERLLAPSETFAATDDMCSATGRSGPRRRGPVSQPASRDGLGLAGVWRTAILGDGGRIGRISRRSHHRGATAGGRELTGRQRTRFDDPNILNQSRPPLMRRARAPNGGN